MVGMPNTLRLEPARAAKSGNDTRLHWTLSDSRADDWESLVRVFDGGFFHDPRALMLAGPTGVPLTAVLRDGNRIEGIAAGLRYRCRLSAKARHAYFPSLPRVRPGVDAALALERLRHAVADTGVSDITFDSFDATASAIALPWGEPGGARHEYRVPLDGDPDLPLRRFSSNHVRHIRRGEREAWRMDVSLADSAAASLALVAESATTRAAARGHAFAAATWDLARVASMCDEQWRVGVYSAFAGDTLLSAVLLGSGGARAFYLAGGSTEDGYARGAATWLHWKAMLTLRERGITTYNLGGAPAGGVLETHPSHGLHRFKSGFGAEVVALNGVRWTDASIHSGLHRAAQRFSAPTGAYAT